MHIQDLKRERIEEGQMVQRTVMKVQIPTEKCRKKIMKSISGLNGIDQIEMDAEKETLTVTGDADPYAVIKRARKVVKYVEVVSIGPPPEANQSVDIQPGVQLMNNMYHHPYVPMPYNSLAWTNWPWLN